MSLINTCHSVLVHSSLVPLILLIFRHCGVCKKNPLLLFTRRKGITKSRVASKTHGNFEPPKMQWEIMSPCPVMRNCRHDIKDIEDDLSLKSYYSSYPRTIHPMQWCYGLEEQVNYLTISRNELLVNSHQQSLHWSHHCPALVQIPYGELMAHSLSFLLFT